MTSGEMIWQSLANEKHLFTKNLGKNCYHIFDQNLKDAKGFLDGLNKFDFVDGKKIKLYRSRIGHAEITLENNDATLHLFPNNSPLTNN